MTHALSCMVIGPGSRSSCGLVKLILDPCSFMHGYRAGFKIQVIL